MSTRAHSRLALALGLVVLAGPALALGAAWAAGPSENGGLALIEAMRETAKSDAVYRNALYLYLRLAGVVWVAVEWIAAILLWRGYRLLLPAIKDREDRK